MKYLEHFKVDPANPDWVNTGVRLVRGQKIKFTVPPAYIVWGSAYGSDRVGNVEGTYGDNPIPFEDYRPDDVIQNIDNPGPDPLKKVAQLPRYSVVGTIYPPGAVPPQDAPLPAGVPAFRTLRDGVIYVEQSGYLWLVYNDTLGNFGNNYGDIDVTVEDAARDSKPSPIRWIPPSIQEKLEEPWCVMAWMLAIEGIDGTWEGYTSWDEELHAPEYIDELGNVTPSIIYSPCVSKLSRLPTQLKLGGQSADVTVLAPREGASEAVIGVYLDRDRIIKGLYSDRHWELFEVDPETDMSDRLLWNVGKIGNIEYDDLAATGELTTYEEISNRNTGDVLHTMCQVGVRIGEDFGTEGGRCRNAIMLDGPRRVDYTVLATVITATKFRLKLRFAQISTGGPALKPDYCDHLANGAVEFDLGEDSGYNSGVKTPVAFGAKSSVDELGFIICDIELKKELPYEPAPGDILHLVGGCRRLKVDCIYYNNLKNMRAQDLPGNDDLNRRVKVV